MGLFSSPNRAAVMNSLPAGARGAGAGMNATFQNAAMVLSIGFFFSLMIVGLAQHLPAALQQGLVAGGVPVADASRVAELPPVGVLFAAFLGYSPVQQLLGGVLGTLPPDQAAYLTGRSFFPQLISGPFADGLAAAFWFAVIACLVAAVASWFAGGGARRGRRRRAAGRCRGRDGRRTGARISPTGQHGSVSEDEFWADVDRHVLRYGGTLRAGRHRTGRRVLRVRPRRPGHPGLHLRAR